MLNPRIAMNRREQMEMNLLFCIMHFRHTTTSVKMNTNSARF